MLQGYDWPGNVRELESLIERAVVLSTSETIRIELLSHPVGRTASDNPLPSLNLHMNLEWVERESVRRALKATDGVKKAAAERLGLSQRALSHYLRKHRLGTLVP